MVAIFTTPMSTLEGSLGRSPAVVARHSRTFSLGPSNFSANLVYESSKRRH